MKEPLIRIGLLTDGVPEVSRGSSGLHRIGNVLIGASFHWQRSITALYEGELEPVAQEGNVRIVNILPVERYIESVIGSEMNPESPVEFLKAHAVISRGWACSKIFSRRDGEAARNSGKADTSDTLIDWMENDDHRGFDVCSDDHCQRYQGVQPAMHERLREAVESTRGEVLADSAGEIADARFSKCCGGGTELFSTCWEDRDPDYLRSFPDPHCDLSGMTAEERKSFLKRILKDYDAATGDGHDWSVTVSKDTVTSRLKERFGRDIGAITGMEVTRRGASGRAREISLTGSNGSLRLGKELMIRRLLGESHLYSSWFDVADLGDSFRLDGHGWGHGVGLCQTGAARMALEGADYREILAFYYPGATLKKIYD